MKIPSSNLGRTCCVEKLFRTFRTIFVHNMFSPCSAKRRASDKDLPVRIGLCRDKNMLVLCLRWCTVGKIKRLCTYLKAISISNLFDWFKLAIYLQFCQIIGNGRTMEKTEFIIFLRSWILLFAHHILVFISANR